MITARRETMTSGHCKIPVFVNYNDYSCQPNIWIGLSQSTFTSQHGMRMYSWNHSLRWEAMLVRGFLGRNGQFTWRVWLIMLQGMVLYPGIHGKLKLNLWSIKFKKERENTNLVVEGHLDRVKGRNWVEYDQKKFYKILKELGIYCIITYMYILIPLRYQFYRLGLIVQKSDTLGDYCQWCFFLWKRRERKETMQLTLSQPQKYDAQTQRTAAKIHWC